MTDTEYMGLVTRAKTKSGMLRIGEPIAFGSDVDIIDELVAAITKLQAERDDYAQEARDAIALAFRNVDRALSAESKVTALETRVGELREALKPFAQAMRKHDDPGVSDLYDEQPVGWVKLGDFRRAHAATSGGTGGE